LRKTKSAQRGPPNGLEKEPKRKHIQLLRLTWGGKAKGSIEGGNPFYHLEITDLTTTVLNRREKMKKEGRKILDGIKSLGV